MDDISFEVAFRGYDTAQVNELAALVGHAIDSGEATRKAQALTALRDVAFDVKMRGYNRRQVENYLDQARKLLAQR